jgi:hypothetical protein
MRISTSRASHLRELHRLGRHQELEQKATPGAIEVLAGPSRIRPDADL